MHGDLVVPLESEKTWLPQVHHVCVCMYVRVRSDRNTVPTHLSTPPSHPHSPIHPPIHQSTHPPLLSPSTQSPSTQQFQRVHLSEKQVFYQFAQIRSAANSHVCTMPIISRPRKRKHGYLRNIFIDTEYGNNEYYATFVGMVTGGEAVSESPGIVHGSLV